MGPAPPAGTGCGKILVQHVVGASGVAVGEIPDVPGIHAAWWVDRETLVIPWFAGMHLVVVTSTRQDNGAWVLGPELEEEYHPVDSDKPWLGVGDDRNGGSSVPSPHTELRWRRFLPPR